MSWRNFPVFTTPVATVVPNWDAHNETEPCSTRQVVSVNTLQTSIRWRLPGHTSNNSNTFWPSFGNVCIERHAKRHALKLPRRLTNFVMARGCTDDLPNRATRPTPGCGGHMDGEFRPPGSAAPVLGRRLAMYRATQLHQ